MLLPGGGYELPHLPRELLQPGGYELPCDLHETARGVDPGAPQPGVPLGQQTDARVRVVGQLQPV